jgi:hypothetical protein
MNLPTPRDVIQEHLKAVIKRHPDKTLAQIAEYIGVPLEFVEKHLDFNHPAWGTAPTPPAEVNYQQLAGSVIGYAYFPDKSNMTQEQIDNLLTHELMLHEGPHGE